MFKGGSECYPTDWLFRDIGNDSLSRAEAYDIVSGNLAPLFVFSMPTDLRLWTDICMQYKYEPCEFYMYLRYFLISDRFSNTKRKILVSKHMRKIKHYICEIV